MAIVHIAMKSSSSAPPSVAHSDYITRGGKYSEREDVGLVESGNMPDFAKDDPRMFWVSADTHERANGRTYTELQIALPRELNKEQREELAKQAAREFMGDRFAYTFAVHNPPAKDNSEQPHMHLMFSERIIDETTRTMPEERFFKRNGAKKDREWNDRQKPEALRVQWCEMMNRAMAEKGIEARVDPRSWADQGREDLAALVEPKELQGEGAEAVERRLEIAQVRELRQAQQEAAAKIAQIEQTAAKEISLIDRAIQAVKEKAKQAVEVIRKLVPSPKEKQRQRDLAWMQEKHPEVLKMTVAQAEQWFKHRLWQAEGTEQNRRKFTARELFMADNQNPKSVQLRADISSVESLDGAISSRQHALANQPPRGLFSRKTENEKTWESDLKRMIPDLEAARTRVNTIEQWWAREGAGIYGEKEKTQNAEVDQRVATIEKNVKSWTRIKEATMPVLREREKQERARTPHKKLMKPPRDRDFERD